MTELTEYLSHKMLILHCTMRQNNSGNIAMKFMWPERFLLVWSF